MRNQLGYMIFFASVMVACWAMRTSLDHEAIAQEQTATSVADLAMPMVKSGKVAGLSIGIVSIDPSGEWRAETQHFGNATGSSGSESRDVPTDKTLYEIGGMTNIFTGILLASAVERGDVSLDTPAADVMPQGVSMPSFGDQKITLAQMVTHRSGLPRLANNMPQTNKADPYHDYTSQLAGEFLNQYKLLRAPGSKYEYSNFAMAYLGYLLTRLSGAESYDAMLSERLTRPLKMTSTRVQLAENDAKTAVGHTAAGKVTRPWHNADMPGAGGVHSTISDMNRFMIANLESPTNEVSTAIDLAFEKQVDPIASDFAMGLGWLIARDGSTRFHNGETGGFHSMMFLSRELKLGVCVLSNTACSEVDGLAGRLLRWKAGITVTIPSADSNFSWFPWPIRLRERDGEGYPRLSPFEAVRWRDQVPQVQVNGTWYELISLNDLDSEGIVNFSRRRFGNLWQKRFEEDLVEVLTRMGYTPKTEVKLVLKPLDSDATVTLERVAMTKENRRAIRNAAQSVLPEAEVPE